MRAVVELQVADRSLRTQALRLRGTPVTLPQRKRELGALAGCPWSTLHSDLPGFILAASNGCGLPCTGKEPKPRPSPVQDGRWRRRKCLNSSDRFPVGGNCWGAGGVRGHQNRASMEEEASCLRSRAAPWGKTSTPPPAWKVAWVFSSAMAPGRKTQAPLCLRGTRSRLASCPSLLPAGIGGFGGAKRAGRANLQVTETRVQR